MKNPFLISDRLYYRALEREDAATVQPWINDPEIRPFVRQHRPMTLHGEVQFIERVTSDECAVSLLVVRKDGDLPIGVAALFQIDHRHRKAEFGITIGDKACWSQAYGQEITRTLVEFGFKTLNLNRIQLHVYEYNQRGIRCYEKVGFRKEGVLRQDQFHDGRYWDTIVMSVLRAEWKGE
jgi:UDP-4-amino-4,6-dideoxy-N-acetyl-beta-L-altrosamine N-acetyltransferase